MFEIILCVCGGVGGSWVKKLSNLFISTKIFGAFKWTKGLCLVQNRRGYHGDVPL